jgi:hypothetical protein
MYLTPLLLILVDAVEFRITSWGTPSKDYLHQWILDSSILICGFTHIYVFYFTVSMETGITMWHAVFFSFVLAHFQILI